MFEGDWCSSVAGTIEEAMVSEADRTLSSA